MLDVGDDCWEAGGDVYTVNIGTWGWGYFTLTFTSQSFPEK